MEVAPHLHGVESDGGELIDSSHQQMLLVGLQEAVFPIPLEGLFEPLLKLSRIDADVSKGTLLAVSQF